MSIHVRHYQNHKDLSIALLGNFHVTLKQFLSQLNSLAISVPRQNQQINIYFVSHIRKEYAFGHAQQLTMHDMLLHMMPKSP